MKYVALGLIVSLSINLQAAVLCVDFAEKKAAEYAGMSLEDFKNDNSLIFTCKHRANPNLETIQFGDGSGLVGLEIEVVHAECVVKDIYSGQDDQDFSEDDFNKMCLPE